MKKTLLLLLSVLISIDSFAEIYKVTAASLNVRSNPSLQSDIIGKVQKGMNIDVKEVKNGFAYFDFMGVNGYASIKYLKKVEQSAVVPVSGQQLAEIKKETAVEPHVSDSHATVYLFYDLTHYFKSFPVTINGDLTFGMEGDVTENKMTGKRYKPSMRKLNVTGEGRMQIATDFYFADKPYHSDLMLDIVDGGVYYVKIYIENLYNAVVKKRSGIYFKQLKPKEGLKELKKDKYKKNSDVDVYL